MNKESTNIRTETCVISDASVQEAPDGTLDQNLLNALVADSDIFTCDKERVYADQKQPPLSTAIVDVAVSREEAHNDQSAGGSNDQAPVQGEATSSPLNEAPIAEPPRTRMPLFPHEVDALIFFERARKVRTQPYTENIRGIEYSVSERNGHPNIRPPYILVPEESETEKVKFEHLANYCGLLRAFDLKGANSYSLKMAQCSGLTVALVYRHLEILQVKHGPVRPFQTSFNDIKTDLPFLGRTTIEESITSLKTAGLLHQAPPNPQQQYAWGNNRHLANWYRIQLFPYQGESGIISTVDAMYHKVPAAMIIAHLLREPDGVHFEIDREGQKYFRVDCEKIAAQAGFEAKAIRTAKATLKKRGVIVHHPKYRSFFRVDERLSTRGMDPEKAGKLNEWYRHY